MSVVSDKTFELWKYGPNRENNVCLVSKLPSRIRGEIEAMKAGLKKGEYFIHQKHDYVTKRGSYNLGRHICSGE
jgi:hypothetical protein